MPLQWLTCPVCGKGFSGLTPGAPCSSICRAKQDLERSLSQQSATNPKGVNPTTGQSATSDPGVKSGSGCSKSAAIFLGAVGLAAWGLTEAVKAVIA